MALVLTRKVGESIVFPGLDITVTLLKIRGLEKVSLMIDAPRAVEVHRAEVLDKIKGGGRRWLNGG